MVGHTEILWESSKLFDSVCPFQSRIFLAWSGDLGAPPECYLKPAQKSWLGLRAAELCQGTWSFIPSFQQRRETLTQSILKPFQTFLSPGH